MWEIDKKVWKFVMGKLGLLTNSLEFTKFWLDRSSELFNILVVDSVEIEMILFETIEEGGVLVALLFSVYDDWSIEFMVEILWVSGTVLGDNSVDITTTFFHEKFIK
jgi:hypothetical protein